MTFAELWHKLAATVDDTDDADADDASTEEVMSMTDVAVNVMTVIVEHVGAAAVMYEVSVEVWGATVKIDVTVA